MNASKPQINVTPLIDVLLVLLIIFMVVSPLKPSNFQTKIPSQSNSDANSNPYTLVVALNSDSSLRLNNDTDLGTVDEPQKLIEKLSNVFQKREENNVFAESTRFKSNLPEKEKIEKTVFIKAPRNAEYGKVVKVIDAVKLAGANPISLQIDDLN